MIKTAIVTGASRGIGSAIAERLAADGFAVCVNYNKSGAEAKSLCKKIENAGGRAVAVGADVSKRDEVYGMVSKVRDAFGPVGLLINNAGIPCCGQFQNITDEAWQRVFSVNVNGAFYATQAVLPDFLHNHDGCIVNIASIWGQNGASCEVPYSCTKHAIIGLTRSLAAELAPSGIRVNCIAPGIIKTDMLSALEDRTIEELGERTPLGRIGAPREIAGAVSFLASDDASFITGQVLTADGGFTL